MALQGFTQSPPSQGLNLVGAIDNMEPSYALELVNIFPGPTAPELRNGYSSYASTGDTSQLNFLADLPLLDGTNRLVGASGTKIWKFTSGVATNITGATSPTNSNFNVDTFANRLYMANGVDTLQVYDGTTTIDSTFTGPTLSTLVNVSSFKERLWFVQKDTFVGWYGNTKASGASALTSNDFQYAFKNGGYLLFAGSYTNQTAQTSADLFFACSSEGEILFYAGSSPADTTNWQVVARYVIGRPMGYRAFVRVNNDIWIITEQGIVPISALFASDPEQALSSVGAMINPLIASSALSIGTSHLWHGVFWPQGRRVFIIVPSGGSATYMLVYGLDSKGWTIYQLKDPGDGVSMCVSNGVPYYASADGKVYTAETGYNDKGNAIAFSGRTAFSFFGQRGNYKAFKDIRPLMRTKRGLTMSLGLDTNFQRSTSLDTITTSTGTYTPWGSPWGSAWSSDIDYIFDRHAVKGQGHSAAIRFSGSIKDAPLELYGFEIRFDLGGQV